MSLTLNLSLNETEVKALLLIVQAASEITWTDKDTREQLVRFSKRVTSQVNRTMPFLSSFLSDKKAELGSF